MARSLGLVLLLAAALLPADAWSAPAPPAHMPTATATGSHVTVARRRHRRRPGCSRFCRQAGGFGSGPETSMPVRIGVQKLRPGADGVVGVRARCALRRRCVGAILLDGAVQYGRADLNIPAGATRTVRVFVTAAGRSRLKRRGADRRVVATVPLRGSAPVSFSDWLTLLPPR